MRQFSNKLLENWKFTGLVELTYNIIGHSIAIVIHLTIGAYYAHYTDDSGR